MNLAEICTVALFVLISFGIQSLNAWILTKSDYEWVIIPVIIFVCNVVAPVILVYKLLLEKGFL